MQKVFSSMVRVSIVQVHDVISVATEELTTVIGKGPLRDDNIAEFDSRLIPRADSSHGRDPWPILFQDGPQMQRRFLRTIGCLPRHMDGERFSISIDDRRVTIFPLGLGTHGFGK